MKVLLSALIATQLLFGGIAVTDLEVEEPVGGEPVIEENIGGDASINAQVTKWYYRTYQGREQKRLWSVTEGYWLTAWIDI